MLTFIFRDKMYHICIVIRACTFIVLLFCGAAQKTSRKSQIPDDPCKDVKYQESAIDSMRAQKDGVSGAHTHTHIMHTHYMHIQHHTHTHHAHYTHTHNTCTTHYMHIQHHTHTLHTHTMHCTTPHKSVHKCAYTQYI